MMPIDVEALRAQVRAMDYLPGTPDEVALWRADMAESRANLAIEDMILSPDEDAMFAMMLDEGLPPALMPSVILTLYGKDATAPDRATVCRQPMSGEVIGVGSAIDAAHPPIMLAIG